MKSTFKITIVGLLIAMFAISGCASSKKPCGCPGQSGMAGYNYK